MTNEAGLYEEQISSLAYSALHSESYIKIHAAQEEWVTNINKKLDESEYATSDVTFDEDDEE